MNDLVLFTRQKQKASGLMGRNKREIELFIGMIYLRDVLELFKVEKIWIRNDQIILRMTCLLIWLI